MVEVHSPQLASGYRHRPAEAAAAFVDGWYRTGDVACLDPDGYLHVLGRAVDLAAAPSPGVRYAAVVPDRDTGRWVAAVVTTARRVAPAARAAVDAEHGPAAAARLVVVPVDRLPLTEQGKPDRPAIRRLGAAAAA